MLAGYVGPSSARKEILEVLSRALSRVKQVEPHASEQASFQDSKGPNRQSCMQHVAKPRTDDWLSFHRPSGQQSAEWLGALKGSLFHCWEDAGHKRGVHQAQEIQNPNLGPLDGTSPPWPQPKQTRTLTHKPTFETRTNPCRKHKNHPSTPSPRM